MPPHRARRLYTRIMFSPCPSAIMFGPFWCLSHAQQRLARTSCACHRTSKMLTQEWTGPYGQCACISSTLSVRAGPFLCQQAADSIPVQKWNSPKGWQVHCTDAAAGVMEWRLVVFSYTRSSAVAKRPRDASCLSVVSFVASVVQYLKHSFFNYGRPLSVSGRPCYILPMFFFIFFMAALFSGPG